LKQYDDLLLENPTKDFNQFESEIKMLHPALSSQC